MTFKDLEIKLKSLVADLISQNTLKEAGDLAKDLVVGRTSKGYGVKAEGAPQTRLKGLSESYKKQRRRLKKQGQLSSETTPTKSNLTKTRQMLNSVDVKTTSNEALVYLNNSEAREKAEHQANEGREFMNLSKSEINKVTKLIEEKLINDIRKKGL